MVCEQLGSGPHAEPGRPPYAQVTCLRSYPNSGLIALTEEMVNLSQGQESWFPKVICKLSKMSRALNKGSAEQGTVGPESGRIPRAVVCMPVCAHPGET